MRVIKLATPLDCKQCEKQYSHLQRCCLSSAQSAATSAQPWLMKTPARASLEFAKSQSLWLCAIHRLAVIHRNWFPSCTHCGIALYLVGRWYGAKALGWVEGNMGELPAIYRWTENAVDKAGSVALVLMPGSNIVCLLLGHKRMDPKRFVPLISLGIAIKLAILWRGGQIFAEQIKSFLTYIEKYQWYVVMALFALSMLQSVRKGRPQGK